MATQYTTEHDFIRQWAEDRNAKPSRVRETGGEGDPGLIRLDFPGYSGEQSLEPISWDDWFRKFDESELVLLYQEKTAGGEKSNFNKLVKRSTLEQELGEPIEEEERGEVRRGRREPANR